MSPELVPSHTLTRVTPSRCAFVTPVRLIVTTLPLTVKLETLPMPFVTHYRVHRDRAGVGNNGNHHLMAKAGHKSFNRVGARLHRYTRSRRLGGCRLLFRR